MSVDPTRELAYPYQMVLTQEPHHWGLYEPLATLYKDPKAQAHIYTKGAWHALDRKEYKIAEEFAQIAQKLSGGTFSAWIIDLELLKRQNKQALIPQKLLQIAQIFEKQNLPAQEVKAYKRLARLDPKPAYYQKVIALYAQIGKQEKAVHWTQSLGQLPRPKEKPLISARPLEEKMAVEAEQPQKLPAIAFGKALWEEYLGAVGDEPPLPKNIEQILHSPCPFWPDKEVQDTHLLVLIPETVDGKPLTLKSLGELVQKPKKGQATQYRALYLGAYKDPPAPKSHWALLTKDALPGTRKKSYSDQQAVLARYCQKAKTPYEVPTILDTTVCIFLEYLRTGIRLYGNRPCTYTRCQEKFKRFWQLVVGGFAPEGLSVRYNVVIDNLGVGGLRKF